jgi:hypothetical protein
MRQTTGKRVGHLKDQSPTTPSSMILPLSCQGGHSARVNMQLLVQGFGLPIAQMGPDFVLLDTPIDHEAGTATIVMQVDESERRWNVHLPYGISAENKRVRIAAVT